MELSSVEPGCLPRGCPRARQSRALTGLVGTGPGTGVGLATPSCAGRVPGLTCLVALPFPFSPGGLCGFPCCQGPRGWFQEGVGKVPFIPSGSGAQPRLEKPQLFLAPCRAPLGMGLGGERRSWMKSKGKHMLGPHPPKQEVGWGHCRPHPMTSSCFWQNCFPTPNFRPQAWGSGTHLIAPDCPGMVPALSPRTLLGQPTGPAWKNPSDLPACGGWKVAEVVVGWGGAGGGEPMVTL